MMKKVICLLAVFIIPVLLASFTHALITLESPSAIYNYGDSLDVKAYLTSASSKQDFLSILLSCNGSEIEIYRSPVYLNGNEEKKINVPLILENSIISNNAGECFLKAFYGGEHVQSKEFEISREINVVLTLSEIIVNPGEKIFIKGEDGGGQARHLIGDQREAPPALFNAAFEGNFVGGQRVEQKGPVQRHVDDLGAQLFLRAQGHVGHGHFLQIGDVFFQVLERVLDLQRKQAAQARAVFGGGDFGLVKNLDGHSVAAVDECRKADQRLPGLFDLHQLGQLAKRPGGVALACGGRWGDARRFRGGGRCPLYS